MHRFPFPVPARFLCVLLVAALGAPLAVAGEPPALDAEAVLPGGIRFRRPSTWTVEARGDGLALRPPNPNPLGEAPVYLLDLEARGGATRPDAEAVVADVAQRVLASAPYLRRAGGAAPIPLAAGRGVVLEWEGKDPHGLVVRARAYVALVGAYRILLLARSSRFVLERHAPVLDAIFGSLVAPAAGPASPAPTPLAALGALGPPRPDPAREWTIVLYLDGDNDLESFALRDLVEMEFGLPPRGVEVVVLIDRAKGFDESAGDWTDARVYRVRSDRDTGRIASEVLARPGEVNMGDPKTLATFLGAALRTFPAKNTMLVLWDHGGGWASMASDFDAPGAPEGHDSLTLPEMGEGVREGLAAAGVEKLDVIGFDMCLMAQLETAAELEGLADVMVASQAVEPGDGWPYDQILPEVGKGVLGARRIGQAIVRSYSRHYDEQDADSATLAALDLRALPDVLQAFDALIRKVEPQIASQWPAISRSIFFSEAYAARTDVRRGTKALASVDLLDMVKRLRHATRGFPAETEYRTLVQAMDRFVLASHTSRQRRLSNGLALYAPVHGAMDDPAHAKTRFASRSAWPAFLSRLHAAQAAHATAPRFTSMHLTDSKGQAIPAAEAQMDQRLSFTLVGDNIVWTQVWFGRDDPKARGMLVLSKGFVVDPDFWKRRKDAVADVVDLIMPRYVDGENHLYQTVDGLVLRVSDGKQAYDATIDASDLDDRDHFRVPALLRDGSGNEIGATILFDAGWWRPTTVIGEFPQPDGRMMLRQVKPASDTQVTLLFETVLPSGKTRYTRGASFAWGSGPELLLDAAAPGTYRAAFVAETITGQQAVETITFPIRESAWISRARGDLGRFEPAALVGTWDHYLVGEKYVPSGLVFEIKPHAKNPALLVAEVRSTKHANVKIHQIIWPDTRLLPCLRFFEFDDEGKQLGYQFATCGFGVQNGKPTLLYKMGDVTRMTSALVKRSGEAPTAAAAGGGPTTTPSNPAPSGPAPSIVGRWLDDRGTVLICGDSGYQITMDGELVDEGRYVIRGRQLVAQSVDGETVVYAFAIEGDQLVLLDEEGYRMALRRVR